MRKPIVIVLLTATMVLAFGASAASAGEINGKGEATAAVTHANSICAYSGQNDDRYEPGLFNDGRVQSFGDIVQEAIGVSGDGHGASAFTEMISGDGPGAYCGGGSNHNRP